MADADVRRLLNTEPGLAYFHTKEWATYQRKAEDGAILELQLRPQRYTDDAPATLDIYLHWWNCFRQAGLLKQANEHTFGGWAVRQMYLNLKAKWPQWDLSFAAFKDLLKLGGMAREVFGIELFEELLRAEAS